MSYQQLNDKLEGLQQTLILWTNIAHKLWEARTTLLPKVNDHGHGLTGGFAHLFTGNSGGV